MKELKEAIRQHEEGLTTTDEFWVYVENLAVSHTLFAESPVKSNTAEEDGENRCEICGNWVCNCRFPW